ncbi:MAG: hypothetical protein GXO68_00560 [Crenarchaeota archaeon]|nr:hypothetical protein [Thermoproteota archaeon]
MEDAKSTVLIVHHKTVTEDATRYFNELVELARNLQEAEVYSVEVDDIDNLDVDPDIVVSLFMFRGGHHASVEERFKDKVVGPLPSSITLLHILRHLPRLREKHDIKEIVLIYYTSKRLSGERRHAVNQLAEMLAKNIGSVVGTLGYTPPSQIECRDEALYVPLSIAPSTLTERLDSSGCLRIPTLLEGSLDLVLSWIIGIFDGFQRRP